MDKEKIIDIKLKLTEQEHVYLIKNYRLYYTLILFIG